MYYFIIIVIAMNVVQAVSTKMAATHLDGTKQYVSFTFFRTLISTLVALTMVIVIGWESDKFSQYAVLFGSLGGVSLSINFISGLYAMRRGSLAFYNVFSLSGMIIPVIYGWFFMSVAFNFYQFIGLVLMIVSSALIVSYNNKIKGKTDLSTIIVSIIALFTNGAVMLFQQLFTHYEPTGESVYFNVLLFGVAALGLLFINIYSIFKNKSIKDIMFKMNLKIGIILMLLGSSVFVISLLMTDLTGIVAPAILFPLVSGLALIFTTIASAVFFKEKINRISIIAIIITIIGIVLLQF